MKDFQRGFKRSQGISPLFSEFQGVSENSRDLHIVSGSFMEFQGVSGIFEGSSGSARVSGMIVKTNKRADI